MKNKRKLLLMHVLFAVLLAMIVLFWKCPTKVLFGIPCPGCGLTRAYFAAFRLDFKQAFSYHPLFPVAVPFLLYVIHYRVLPKRFPLWLEWVFGTVIGVGFIGVYAYRMLMEMVY